MYAVMQKGRSGRYKAKTDRTGRAAGSRNDSGTTSSLILEDIPISYQRRTTLQRRGDAYGGVVQRSAVPAEGSREGDGSSNTIPIPNASEAVIDPRKLTEYALNPEHAIGGAKAIVFKSALGYDKATANDLIGQIRDKLPRCNAVLGNADGFGQRYKVNMLITGPNGKTANVRTCWIIKVKSNIPELVTLFVEREGNNEIQGV